MNCNLCNKDISEGYSTIFDLETNTSVEICGDCSEARLIASGKYKRCGCGRLFKAQYIRCLECADKIYKAAGITEDRDTGPDGKCARPTNLGSMRSGPNETKVTYRSAHNGNS